MGDLSLFKKNIHFQFNDESLLELALTHKSYVYENKLHENSKGPQYNERLEFLGDSVLQLILTEALYRNFPFEEEGTLSKMRSSLVNEAQLYQLAKTLQIPEFVRVGKGERKSLGHEKPRLLAGVMEALFGAIYLDAGLEAARGQILSLYKEALEKLDPSKEGFINRDYKTQFQEVIQKLHKVTPEYRVVSETQGVFEIELRVQDKVISRGQGVSKKQAEQVAAQIALGSMIVKEIEELKITK